MGRPPLNVTRTHIGISPEALKRIDTVVGEKGRSKFVRDAIDARLDRIAPTHLGPPYFEHGVDDERLTPSGTAAILKLIRKHGWDDVARRLELTDPNDFLLTLLGHRPLSLPALRYLVSESISNHIFPE